MRLERILIFLMVLSIFLDDFILGGTSSDARRASSFDFYYYYLIFLSFLTYVMVKTKKIPFLPKWLARTLLFVFTISIITGVNNAKIGFPMFKQMIGITFSAVAYFNLFRFTGFDIKRIFRLYLQMAFWVAMYGIVEELLMLGGYQYLFDNAKRVSLGFYRVYSIMGEPYFLSVALIPALYYHLNNFFETSLLRDYTNKFQFGAIFLCYFLTFSSAGIFGLGIMVLLLAYNRGYFSPTNGRFLLFLLVAFVLIPSLDLSEKFSMQEVQVRAMDSYKAFSSGKPLEKEEVADLNSSTFALYSNYIIAQESFAENPFSGSGLGTHEKTYDEYFELKFGRKFKIMYGNFNAKDGNSLFIRLMSEMGLVGLFIVFYFLFKFFNGRKNFKIPELKYYVILNQAVFIVIIIRLIRTGNYIGQGFFLFIFLYYYTNEIIKNYKPPVVAANEPVSVIQ